MKAQAVLFTGIHTVTVDQTEVPDPSHGEVLVQVAYSCISPGTELRCLAGQQPNSSPLPYIPGYSAAGTIVARGAGVSLKEGTPVFCGGTHHASHHRMWGGHISHVVKPETQVFPLPDGIDLLDASAAKLAAIAYRGVRLSKPQPHETVAVIGLGPIGQLSARLHHLTGAHVVAADLSAERVELARAAGVEAVVPTDGLQAAYARVFHDGADVVVDATGAVPVLGQAIGLAKSPPWDDSLAPGSRLVIQGSYPGDFAVPYQEAFMKELTLLIPRDQQPRDLRTVLDLMQRGRLVVRDLIGEVLLPEDAPRIYDGLRANKSGLLTAAFRWR